VPARRAATALACFLLLLATRLCHVGIIWVEEAYPAAGAIQMLAGKTIYRDFWFDKPPLSPLLYLLWGGYPGWPLRVAGAILLTIACMLLYVFAERLWSQREAAGAALLLAFFFTFDFPASTLAVAPDLLMTLPHIAAVFLAWRGRAFWSGVLCGVALQTNPKAVFVVAACLLWTWRRWPMLLLGFAVSNVAVLGWLAAVGALPQYMHQVWIWGFTYARDTYLEHPFLTGIEKTGSWAFFHLALVIGAGLYFYRRETQWMRMALWIALTLIGVAAGWRFFERYYFLLLIPMTLLAGRAFVVSTRAWKTALALALLIPFVRFAPRYAMVALDALQYRHGVWNVIWMNEDSAEAACIVETFARPGDTLLVWGYRPDIYVYTRVPAATPWLDSQPLTGVIADRHLTDSRPTFPELAARNRAELVKTTPTFIVDGLTSFSKPLEITNYPDLQNWLASYHKIGQSRGTVIYDRNEPRRENAR